MVFDSVWLIFVVVTTLLLLTLRQVLANKEKPFWAGLMNIWTVLIILVISTVGRIALLLFMLFYQLQYGLENHYADFKGEKNPLVIIKGPSVFLSAEAPEYIGAPTSGSGIELGDTLFPVASYNKGKGVTGTKYFCTEKNGVKYWVPEDEVMGLFKYTYSRQPLKFTVRDSSVAEVAWTNAIRYMSFYKKYHGNDITDVIDDNNHLYALVDRASNSLYLRITRTPALTGGFEFSVSSAGRGDENCIIERVKDRLGNRPENDRACAYYIMNGSFYEDEK